MSHKTPRLGIDRFLALHWVDMALDLCIANSDQSTARQQLRAWLSREIEGQESARKTADQIIHLWLIENDPYSYLRKRAISSGLVHNHNYRHFLHFGLAINVFPLFANVCKTTGRLLNLQASCTSRDIYQRIQECYGNPTSIKRATTRTLQTLIDWGLLANNEKGISPIEFLLSEPLITEWLLTSLIYAYSTDRIPLADLVKAPELLGIRFEDVRAAIRSSQKLRLERWMDIEMVIVK